MNARDFQKQRRREDAQERGDGEYVPCISCGKIYHWEDMDGGHFISRRFKSTLLEKVNVHAQCRICNRMMGGKTKEYERAIVRLYGQDTLDNLLEKKYASTHNI
jgi:Bacteriophage Lambda NinG protein